MSRMLIDRQPDQLSGRRADSEGNVATRSHPLQPDNLAAHKSALWRTCISSLERFYLADAGILSRKVVWNGVGLRPTAEPSPRNTAEVVKALHLLRRHGFACRLDPDALMDELVKRYLPALAYADVALALWADALGGGRHLSVLWEALLQRLPTSASDTMELAWTLSALCHFFPVAAEPNAVATLAHRIREKIAQNQSPATGLFHASARRRGWLRRRDRSASLVSQTSAVQALALYAQAFRVPEALERPDRCAEAVCGLQGPQGQWWWTYDVQAGNVTTPYPVYSVNQDAAVPMALDELHKAGGHARYRANIIRGLAWLFGDNELTTSLVDEATGVIWRAVDRSNGNFRIVREMYSYHPARCLYWLCSDRFSGRVSQVAFDCRPGVASDSGAAQKR